MWFLTAISSLDMSLWKVEEAVSCFTLGFVAEKDMLLLSGAGGTTRTEGRETQWGAWSAGEADREQGNRGREAQGVLKEKGLVRCFPMPRNFSSLLIWSDADSTKIHESQGQVPD